MIVNHRYRFIFLKTRKVGGTSVELALSKYCDANDVVTPIIPEETVRTSLGYQRAVNYEAIGVKNHTTASEAKQKLGDAVWNTYFKFTVLRDPVEVAISDYYWKNKNPDSVDFDTWVTKNQAQWNQNWGIHSIDGKPCLDFYVLYHRYNSDLTRVSKILNLPGDLGEEVRHISAKSQARNNRVPSIAETTRRFIQTVSAKDNELINKVQNS